MLTRFWPIAKIPKTAIILNQIRHNWHAKRRFESGKIDTTSGTIHSNLTVSESLSYISQVFDDYLKFSDISRDMLQGKRVEEALSKGGSSWSKLNM
jgi:hypothetical protein